MVHKVDGSTTLSKVLKDKQVQHTVDENNSASRKRGTHRKYRHFVETILATFFFINRTYVRKSVRQLYAQRDGALYVSA